MAKISKRGGFSDRNGIKPENKEIQYKGFDKRTRIQLLNMIKTLFGIAYAGKMFYQNECIQEFLIYVRGEIYSEAIDPRKVYDDEPIFRDIESTLLNDEYDDVLTLIEALIQYWDEYLKREDPHGYYDGYHKRYLSKSLYEIMNSCFEKDYVGYRFVDGIIVPISDDYEIAAINETLASKHKPVYEHISKANRLLADRECPDYENSIKESISAVEAMCEIITGCKGADATLGNMLKKLDENGVVIHKSLKSAFNALYGYSSDAKGIRHAGDIGGEAATFAEAKYMLVTCCGFINYLTALSSD